MNDRYDIGDTMYDEHFSRIEKKEINLVYIGLDKITNIPPINFGERSVEVFTNKINECIECINMLIDIQNDHLSKHWRNER